jgi:Peptidoglycan-binding protein, CsiV
MIRRRAALLAIRMPWLLLALGVAQAQAPASAPAAPVYNIELVVFRGGGGASEDWSAPGARAPVSGGDANSGNAQIGRFVGNLTPSQFQLANEVAKLRATGQYQILTHIAWQQTASSWGTRAGFTLARLGSKAGGLSGMVYFERGTYLHLGVNIAYNGAGPSYRIDETRRVKFYEKQYYDHPAIGVLALVTPSQGARPPGR